VIRQISRTSPLERAATLEDVRAQVLSPERLNAFVLSGFAGIALLHRRRRRGRRAGVLSERADARVRRAAGVGASPRRLPPRPFRGRSHRGARHLAGARAGSRWKGAHAYVETYAYPARCPFSVRRLCSSALRLWRR